MLADLAEDGSAALSLDDLDGAAGGILVAALKVGGLVPMAGLNGE